MSIKAQLKKYMEVVNSIEIFNEEDRQTLEETIEEFLEYPDDPVDIMITEYDEDKIMGFALFGTVPLTKRCWDIYWIVVSKEYQGRGVGKKLVGILERIIKDRDPNSVIKVETSTKKEYSHARNLYKRLGYIEGGRIPEFYSEHDDLIVFYKKLADSK